MPFGVVSDGQRRNLENLSRRKQRRRRDRAGRLNVGGAGSDSTMRSGVPSPELLAKREAAKKRAQASRRAENRRDVRLAMIALCIAALLIAALGMLIAAL